MSLNPGDEDSHNRWDQDARNSVFIKRSSNSHNSMSDSESSVGDSLWSGSASSSWMSTPSLSAIRPSDLYMSSLPAQKQVVEQNTLSTSADSSAESWISHGGRQSEGFNTPVTPPSHSKIATTQPDPAAFHANPRNQVDYLSYDWTLEDISASWRYIALNKKTHPKGERLEYASWRAWEKLRSRLHTVTPESLNWLKDSDDTWLYGPFKRASPKATPKGFRRQALTNQSLSSTPSSTGILLTRPILKKSASIDTVKETVVLLRSLSAGSLANRDISVLQWRKKLKADNKSPPLHREAHTSTRDPQYTPEAASPRREHVHFKFQENNSHVPNEDHCEGIDLLPPRLKRHDGSSDVANTPNSKWSFKSKLGGSQDWDNKTSCALNCDHEHASDKRPKKDVRSLPNSSTPPKRQNSSLFFLDDSDDEDFDICPVHGKEESLHESVSKVAESPKFKYNLPGSPDPAPTFLMPVDTTPVSNTSQTSEPEKDPYWLVFHSAMSRLQAVPLLKPDNAYINDSKTEKIAWVKSSNFSSDHISTPPFYIDPDTRGSSKARNGPSAYTVSRLLSLRGQEAEECFGNFYFGSVPPRNRFDEEDDDAVFHMGELDLLSTGADLSEWILQKRRRDWWFVNEGVATSTLDSTQEDFMPSLTQIPPGPSNGELAMKPTTSEEASVAKISINDAASNLKRELGKTELSQETPIDEQIHLKESLLQPHTMPSIHPVPEESAKVVNSPQDTERAKIDLDSCSPKSDEVEIDAYEIMTDSCEDDSLGSADGDSLYSDCGAMQLDHYTHDECLDSALAPMQQELVNKIMAEFWIIFNQTWANGIQQCPTGTTASHDRKQSTGSTISDSSSSPLSPRKRRRRDDEPPEDRKDKGKEAGGSDDPVSVGGEFEEAVRFACPFRKHDPHFYNLYDHSVCVLSNWSTIARVKEHLYRAHRMPIHCKRCWETFKSQDLLDAHLTVAASSICDLKPGTVPQGLTAEQERRLRSRKKSSSNQSNEDRWREIYEILFPNEEVPSPYYEYIPDETHMSPESTELANYEAYMRRELPRLVRRNIEDIVRQALGPLHSSLIGDFVGIVRDSQDAAFRAYRQSQGLDDELPQPPDPMPALRLGLVGMEDETSLDPASIIQQPGLITAMFQAPPSQSSDSMLSLQLMDDVRSRSSINEIRSEPDSGYASEETLPCGCLHFCQCPNNNTATRARGAIDIAVREYADGEIPWNAEWATYPDWNQLECVGGTFEWQNGG